MTLRLKPTQASRHITLRLGQIQIEYSCQLVRHTHQGERSTLSCPPVKKFPTLHYQLQQPSGSPDHHRGLHKHHIRGCGPLLMLLSLIPYSKLVS
jgi:hypothetical protein